MYTHVAHTCSSHIEYYIITGHVCWNFTGSEANAKNVASTSNPQFSFERKKKQQTNNTPPPKKIQREEKNPTKLKNSNKTFIFRIF